MISRLHETAQRYAAAGIAVFPCRQGAKEPATAHGWKDATTDVITIDRWWTENPNYNLAIALDQAGLCVVDLDVKDDGPDNWQALAGDRPTTYTVATPSGGQHLYYRGSLPPSVSKLAPGIDTRGRGSYVLAPPSIVEGKPYILIHNGEIAPLPAWIPERLAYNATPHAAPENVALDSPATLRWASQMIVADLAEDGPPVEGEASDNRAYEFINVLLDGPSLGQTLSPHALLQLLCDEWAPDFDEDWLDAKIGSALKHRQNAPGCAPPGSPERKYGDPSQYETATPEPKRRGIWPHEAANRKPPDYWDEHKLMMRQVGGSVSLIYAAFSNYKSTWSANYAIDIIKRTDARVLYVLGEGAGGFAPLTLGAAVESWNLDHPDDTINLEWLQGRLLLDEDMPRMLDDASMIEFTKGHQDFHPNLVFIDTLGNAAAGHNLSAIEVGTAIGRVSRLLARAFEASVFLIHHEGRNGTAMGSQYIVGNDPDMVLRLEHDPVKSALTVTVGKDKWGVPNRKVRFGTRKLMVPSRYDGSLREAVATYELPATDARTVEREAAEQRDTAEAIARRVLVYVLNRCDRDETTTSSDRHGNGPAAIASALGIETDAARAALDYCGVRDWLTYRKRNGQVPGSWAPGRSLPLGAAPAEVY